MSEVLRILIYYREGILQGLFTTLRLVAIAWFGGLILGSLVGFVASRSRVWGSFFKGISFFLSSIPVLVFLFWVHYPLQAGLKIVIDPFITAAAVLTLLNSAAVGEIIRNALDTFDRDYVNAGVVCGLSTAQIFWYVQVPVFLRQVIPSLLRAQVSALHMTLFASLISVDEIFRICLRINAETYKPIEIFTALALLFLIVSFPLNWLAAGLEQRFHGGFNKN